MHTVHTNETTGEVYDKWDDTALFDFYFEKVDLPEDSFDRVITRYEAISCIEYINGPYWNGYTQVEKESALAQLEFGENQLCPNVPSYLVNGGSRTQGGTTFRFLI